MIFNCGLWTELKNRIIVSFSGKLDESGVVQAI